MSWKEDITFDSLKNLSDYSDTTVFTTKQALFLLGCGKREYHHVVTGLIREKKLLDCNQFRSAKSNMHFTAKALREVQDEVKRRIAKTDAKKSKKILDALKGAPTAPTNTDPSPSIPHSLGVKLDNITVRLNQLEGNLRVADTKFLAEKLAEIDAQVGVIKKSLEHSGTDSIPGLNNRLAKLNEYINLMAKDLSQKTNTLASVQADIAQINQTIKSLASTPAAGTSSKESLEALQRQINYICNQLNMRLPFSIPSLPVGSAAK